MDSFWTVKAFSAVAKLSSDHLMRIPHCAMIVVEYPKTTAAQFAEGLLLSNRPFWLDLAFGLAVDEPESLIT